ncbi:MAG: 3-deoxy-7-phosphoheptulonate synthase [Candidatus Margulisiibacteriota bacterium]
MSIEYIRRIPSVEEILSEIPLSKDLLKIKREWDERIAKVFVGNSNHLVVIIGPCSAHDEDAVCDYVSRLAKLQEKVADRLIMIPRIYTNKPRTTGEGYKGMAHQPKHQEEPNMVEGLKAIRRMHVRSASETHLFAADEMLYPENFPYLEDVLSYVAVGARSVENQKHRLTVSGLNIPVGMKNPTSGDVDVMLNSVKAAQIPHIFSYNGWEVKTTGNPLAHSVLRGSVNPQGQHIPNYHYEDLIILAELYLKRGLQHPSVIVDTNHSNSGKLFAQQPRIAMEVLGSRKHSPLLKSLVKGFMIESFIEEGSQKAHENVYGRSITDPCLGWESTATLIEQIAEAL